MENELFPDNTPPPEEVVVQPGRTRECDVCHREYVYKKISSKFCSSKCKDAFHTAQRSQRVGSVTDTNVAPTPAGPTPIASRKQSEIFADQPIHIRIAVDLLTRDRDSWAERCKKLEKEVEDLEEELGEIEEKMSLKDHQLNGLQEQQPTSFQKFMSAIPAEVMVEMAPRLGSAVDMLFNGFRGGLSGAGTKGDPQLDAFIAWFGKLPPEMQSKVVPVITAIAQKEGLALDSLLSRLTNILKYDNPLGQQNYGTFNAGAFASPTGT